MDPQVEQEARARGQALAQRIQAGEQLPPDEMQEYLFLMKQGLAPKGGNPVGNAGPDRQMVANALRGGGPPPGGGPPSMTTGGQPPMGGDPAQYVSSHDYGGTIGQGSGVGGYPVDPNEMMMHFAEQQMLKEAGQPYAKDQTAVEGALTRDPNARMENYANTEVRPWAQRTPQAFMQQGQDPRQAPLQPGLPPGTPIEGVMNGQPQLTDEEIMKLLLQQQQMPQRQGGM